MKRVFLVLGLLGSVVSSVGCDNPSSALNDFPAATLQTSDDLSYWSSASAPNVYFTALVPLAMIELIDPDAGCPTKTTSGNVDTYEGGCNDADTTWLGKLVVDNGAPDGGTGSVRYEDFGTQQSQACGSATLLVSSTFRGTFNQTASGDDSSFQLNLRADVRTFDEVSCDPIDRIAAWDYQGTANSVTEVWNGSGRIGDSTNGVVSAETVDERLGDSPCSSEAQTGTTTLHGGSDVAVITYDGESQCDPSSTVTWTLNGTSMGTVSGIRCAAASGSAGLPSLALLLGGALLWLRRRSRP